ncbi:TadE family type IV pilus minor pilin [Nocardioides sp.]|uniref:TadE family type IV pilus minor pilin n=1 Tax=Nocardioides sp. TaxID=35761 RepID=UPI00262E550B|nr:TadE family type IV pilus minor pilin [Nocardioides sp.]MDI6910566.1 TadE family type IV pilus minor pilin [Nocardioides sp.]
MSSSRGGRRDERGAATAELAMVLPLLVAITIGLVWLLAVGAAQVRAVDAAREAARAVARGDSVTAAVARGEDVAPSGSRVSVHDDGGQVTAVVVGRVRGPGGLFGRLPGVTVSAQAVALTEGSSP